MKIVNYLDVTLNLTTGKYYPFRKPDNNPLYINAKSNHSASIIRQIPASISTWISSLSCDPQTLINHHSYTMMPLDPVLPMKQSSMRKTGKPQQKRRIEPAHVTLFWFNPRFSQSVQTNVAKSFHPLIDKNFTKSHKLHKIFNRNNHKVSYSCNTKGMHPNIGIGSHQCPSIGYRLFPILLNLGPDIIGTEWNGIGKGS